MSSSDALGNVNFETTRWTMILAAQGSESIAAQRALGQLCELYWYPLYVFVRRRGNSPHDAQDLTQAFFQCLLEKDFLADVMREKGRFRSFLLGSMKHFLANEWHRSQAQKRGGGTITYSLDDEQVEERYLMEPVNSMTAEDLYQRRWAMTLLDQVICRLKNEMSESGKGEVFEAMKEILTAGKAEQSFAEIGAQIGMTAATARVAGFRLKKRYRELLREEISQTVADSADVDDEIRYLVSVLGAR